MGNHTIHFLPADQSVDVAEGTTIAAAAQQADVAITNLCGGEGVCGKCRVQVTKGRAQAEEHAIALLLPGPNHERVRSGLPDRNP